jgi:hypothetical protein
MHVIAKRSILFIHEEDARSGSSKRPRSHEVKLSAEIQDVPDWVGEQEAFKVATQGKEPAIIVVGVKAPAIDVTLDQQEIRQPEITDHHVKFLNARGYPIKSLKEAVGFVANLNDRAREGFLADAAAWTEELDSDKDDKTGPGPDALEKMTKAELQAHAEEVYGLELDDNLKKDEMLTAIREAAAKGPAKT